MRWQSSRRSENVQDRRRVGLVGGGIGAIIVTVVALMLGVNPGDLVTPASDTSRADGAIADEKSDFVAAVLGDTEDTWNAIFQQNSRDYPEPQLVLFSQVAQSACGFAQSAVGPFYCPRDQSIYIDLSFYDALRSRFNAPGDFAQAYVIAHEVGHHVQNVLGVLETGGRSSGPQSNSVKIELQADCFAGIWAHHAQNVRKLLEPGDIEEALNAASAIGDDAIQKRQQGYVVPESFTHGSSQQRVNAFRKGFDSGNANACESIG